MVMLISSDKMESCSRCYDPPTIIGQNFNKYSNRTFNYSIYAVKFDFPLNCKRLFSLLSHLVTFITMDTFRHA